MSLRPPSTSPSPSPGPENGKHSARQSMGPSARGTPTLAPGSPRLAGSGARPTSELVGSAGLYQTPEAEALDQWFENLQNYEATLEDMAAASLDVNFKEELSAIEQWFKVLSEAERTAALYSLLQHSTQVQIRFFITVLQQMARSDPMTALLSPAVGGSMQAQMEAKLASLKSPGLKSGLPASPTTRNFNQAATNRQSLIEPLTPNSYLSPESAALGQPDAASTLAQQRAKLKAANAAHRISAPIMPSTGDRNTWGAGGLGQVQEANRPASPSATEDKAGRPKSTEFTGRPPAPQEATVPAHASSESWASMVTTPLPMFGKPEPKEPGKAEWKTPGVGGVPGVPRMGDPTIHRRGARQQQDGPVYDDNGNFVASRGGGNMNQQNWRGATSPGLSATSSNRFGSDDGSGAGVGGGSNNGRGGNNGMNGLGGMGGFGMGMGMNNGNGMGMNPFAGVNMNMLAMGISPETQLLAAQMAQAQMAAAGGAFGMGMGAGGAGWLGMQQQGNRMMMGRGPNQARTPKSATGMSARSDNAAKGDDDVDPALLNDIPAWLRSLRLHKYTPNFDGMRWQDMVVMDEAALEAKGVAALGARRKMLKTFELVRKKMGIEGGPPAISA